jgi:hypothetical protein
VTAKGAPARAQRSSSCAACAPPDRGYVLRTGSVMLEKAQDLLEDEPVIKVCLE